MKIIFKEKYHAIQNIRNAVIYAYESGRIIDKIILTDDEYNNLYDYFSSSLDYAYDREELLNRGTITFEKQTIKIEVH